MLNLEHAVKAVFSRKFIAVILIFKNKEDVNQNIYIIWCSCFYSFMRIYTSNLLFSINLPSFSFINPSFERVPAIVINC